MPRPNAHRLPPRDRTEPGICVPDTPFQSFVIVVAAPVVIFSALMLSHAFGG